jgi:hypothetical protein
MMKRLRMSGTLPSASMCFHGYVFEFFENKEEDSSYDRRFGRTISSFGTRTEQTAESNLGVDDNDGDHD